MKSQNWKAARSGKIALSTILSPDERLRVDAAGEGLYLAHHRSAPSEVANDVRKRKASAVLLSVACCESTDWPSLRRLVRELPRIPTIALLGDEDGHTAATLLKLGQTGVHEVIDIRMPTGWTQLRAVLSQRCVDSIEARILQRFESSSAKVNSECWTFFETLIRVSRQVSSVRELAGLFHVLPSTLMSRFFRAGLPAPKRYLAMARLLRAAYLFENSGFSIANVANHLEYSSPQSFGRHVRKTMGMTALEFRRQYRGADMLRRFEQELIEPYRRILREFNPLSLSAYCVKPSESQSPH
jgi:AraC-like DNA-binding protein